MKRSLLDTDTLSYFLKGFPDVVDRASSYIDEHDRIEFSIITYYEIVRGLVHAGATRKLADFEQLTNRSELWPLDRESARAAGEIWAQLRAQGLPLDEADILIAAIARTNGLVLITHNTDHFSRVGGLELDNWLAGDND